MTLEQGIVLGVIVGIFGLFAWGQWRYDIVAVIGLFSLVVADVIVVKVLRREGSALIDPDRLSRIWASGGDYCGGVVVISRALRNSGVVDLIRVVAPFAKNQTLHIASLCVVAAVLSAFITTSGRWPCCCRWR